MVNIRKLHSQAKILGTIVTVGGAMLMTLVNGPMLTLPWTRSTSHHQYTGSTASQDPIKGALMITAGCFCWASFMILQVLNNPSQLFFLCVHIYNLALYMFYRLDDHCND